MDGKEIQIINVTLIYIYGSLLRFNKISIRLCDVDTKDTHTIRTIHTENAWGMGGQRFRRAMNVTTMCLRWSSVYVQNTIYIRTMYLLKHLICRAPREKATTI